MKAFNNTIQIKFIKTLCQLDGFKNKGDNIHRIKA